MPWVSGRCWKWPWHATPLSESMPRGTLQSASKTGLTTGRGGWLRRHGGGGGRLDLKHRYSRRFEAGIQKVTYRYLDATRRPLEACSGP